MTSPMNYTSSEELQRGLAAKQNKLAELRAKRAEREEKNKKLADAAISTSPASSTQDTPDDLLKSVAHLIGSPPPAAPEPAAGTPTADTRPAAPSGPRVLPTLTFHTPSPIDIFPVEVIKYDQGIQVDILSSEDAERIQEGEMTLKTEMGKQQEKLKEKEENLQKIMAQVQEEKRQVEEKRKEDEKKRAEDAAARRDELLKTSDFFDRRRFERTSKRSPDDPTPAADSDDEQETKTEEKLVQKVVFGDAKKNKRPITALDWNPKYPELLLVSYADQEDKQLDTEADGLVMIWNGQQPSRPEFTFYCQSAVLTALFHPSNPKLVIGGTRSGQVVIWDMREKNKTSPVNRTSLSSGHTHPLYAVATVPTINRHNIISVSTDGHLCVWSDINLHTPSSEILLRGKEEITTTSFDFPGRETNTILLGSDEGYIYKAHIYDRKGIFDSIRAHTAPITNIHCHPFNKTKSSSEFSNYFLTSSYDWTVKLWSNKTKGALLTFESARDYVHDVQWSPTNPAVFASADGTGKVDIWNLNADTEVPYYTAKIPDQGPSGEAAALSRLRWSNDGKLLATGSSIGNVYVYDVSSDLATSTKEQTDLVLEKLSRWGSRENIEQNRDIDDAESAVPPTTPSALSPTLAPAPPSTSTAAPELVLPKPDEE